jgi:hypothetical protein
MKILGIFFVVVAISHLFLAYRVATDKIKLSKSTQISVCVTASLFIFVSALKYF